MRTVGKKAPARRRAGGSKKPWLRRILRWLLIAAACFYGLAELALVGLRWIDPPFTMVHAQRRVESWFEKGHYQKRYKFVALGRISADFQHAVISAEDGNFYQHHGFDWGQIKEVIEDDLDGGRARGASTITQQLVKNLFFTTHRSAIRKGLEISLVPLAELTLLKKRILELYLNVIEWGPGVFGAEAGAQYHYGVAASQIGREQSARLAAVLPSPRRRRPSRMNEYSEIILDRMKQRGW